VRAFVGEGREQDNRTLSGYLDAVASAAPTPGGGSVAAIVGALAAALGEMVTNLSVDRVADAGAAETLRRARERLAVLRGTLAEAAAADERAYAGYREAAALPRGDAAAKRERLEAMQRALTEATEAPLAVARGVTETAEILVDVALLGNPHLRTDAALGALLAAAALRGALLNVRGNAALLRNGVRATAYREEADRLEEGGRTAADRAFRFAAGGASGGQR
jgi:formiminotetrahydrofolate cyclodeaminase